MAQRDPSEILIFGGSGSPELAQRICDHLAVTMGRSEVLRFSEGTLFVRVLENVRGRHVYIVQSTVFPANDHFMELLFWIDALKRASAESVTVVMPYFSYAKGDKKDEPRVSIRARVCADCIEAAGADRVVTIDLHALKVLCDAVVKHNPENLVVVAPDAGFVKDARRYASYLGASLAIANKERKEHDERAEVLEIIGDVDGSTALIVDDFTISGGTLVETARRLEEKGVRRVLALVTHGVFSSGSMEMIDDSPIERLFVTDSIEDRPTDLSAKIELVSIAPLLGEAIRRIDKKESISVLFPQ